MSRPHKPWLDWHREREKISTLLSRPGGVLRVQASPKGPLLEFANALRSHLDNGNWKTVQFDTENPNTRYFGEIIRQIERSMLLEADIFVPVLLGEGSKVGSDLAASQITITNSFNLGTGEYEQTVALENRAQRIIQSIRERTPQQSFCFIFLYSEQFRRQDLTSFRDLLWFGGLAERTSKGVLLVDLTSSTPRTDIEWPPSLDVNITLAEDYDNEAREHAIADLSEFLLASGLETTELEAMTYSRAMLDSHKGPSALYAQLAAISFSRRLRDHAARNVD